MPDNENDILEMEKELAGDQSGQFRRAVIDELQMFRNEVKREQDKGLTPEEFSMAEGVKAALDTAISVMEKVNR